MIGLRVSPIDKECAEFDRPDVPGLVMMSIENGKAAMVRSYGLAHLETRVRCQPWTNFRLASVSKQFTAMAILMLVERKQLSLDDKLPRFFSSFPRYGNDISLRHLLTQSSGLLDYEDLIPAGTTAALKDRDVLEILQRQDKTYFGAGDRFRYSNGGYALLALVVECVTRTSFAEFLREHIFLPLGMEGTVAYEAGISEVAHRALGYSKKGDAFVETDQSLTSAVLGDGGIYSSVNDLCKWDQALDTERLISRPHLREAFTAHSTDSDVAGSGYGFGWYVERKGGEEHVWHHGSTCGFTTSYHRFPARKRSLILLANRSAAGLEGMVRKCLDAAGAGHGGGGQGAPGRGEFTEGNEETKGCGD
jgi:CubicO group peptidase (beta-lactamase class C family)